MDDVFLLDGPAVCLCGICPCELTTGEMLLVVANDILHPSDQILEAPSGLEDHDLAAIHLSLAFARADASLRFRAIYEGWDRQRIVRELY